jgi:hypothetical protein
MDLQDSNYYDYFRIYPVRFINPKNIQYCYILNNNFVIFRHLLYAIFCKKIWALNLSSQKKIPCINDP